MNQEPTSSVRLWDAPVRLVHWAFVILLPLSWWTHRAGEMEWHARLGYTMLGLVVFRIYWGFAGSSTARFRNFVKGPAAVRDYLLGRSRDKALGHNPLGALSVLLLLGLLLVQVTLGLFSEDTDGLVSGALATHVSYETTEWAGEWHEIIFNVILAAVALHIAAILYYLLRRRDNLIGPMITGRKSVTGAVETPTPAPLWRMILGIVLSAAFAWWVSRGATF